MLKRAYYLALLFGLTLGAASGPAQAISLEFVPTAQSVALGAPVVLALRITELGDLTAPSLGTYDLDLGFDPALLAFASVSFGDPSLGDQLDLLGLGSISAATPSPGGVNLFELSLDAAADLNALQAGEFILATLSFDTLAVGASPLIVTLNALGDADGNALVASVAAGSLTVVPEPATLWLLAAGLAGITGLRRHRP